MSDDLEKFLQRAAQKRRQQTRPSIVIINEDTVEADIVEPEIVRAEVVSRSKLTDRVSVGEHVKHHLDSSIFDRRASHLGEDVESESEEMEQHVHDVFDHSVGTLGPEPADEPELISDDDPPQVVRRNWIADMLRNPATMRQVIVLNEIMTPAFRRKSIRQHVEREHDAD
jgi:hypothetical protein